MKSYETPMNRERITVSIIKFIYLFKELLSVHGEFTVKTFIKREHFLSPQLKGVEVI